MALSSLPKSFDLDSGSKATFPYHFNVPENWDYIGPYPDVKFYDPEGMRTEGKEGFDEWYANKVRSGERFNFRKHLFEYCDQDVRILREAIITFRRMILDSTNIDPFLNTYTIS